MIDQEFVREYRRKNDILTARLRAQARSQELSLEEIQEQLRIWRERMRKVLRVPAP